MHETENAYKLHSIGYALEFAEASEHGMNQSCDINSQHSI